MPHRNITTRDRRDGRRAGTGARLVFVLGCAVFLASCAQIGDAGQRDLDAVKQFFADLLGEREKPKKIEKVSVPPPPPEKPAEDVVKPVQRHLLALGYNPGFVDGVMGPKTAAAIRNYQRANGLVANGEASAALLAHLDRTAAVQAAERPTSLPLPAPAKPPAPAVKPPPSAEPKPAQEPQLALPVYRVGTSFIYSDGRVSQVAAVKGRRVKWRRKDGAVYTTDRNFLLPHLYWETTVVRGRSRITKPDRPNAGQALWPDKSGSEVGFDVEKTLVARDKSENVTHRKERWHCVNEARVLLRVTAGAFDTVKFTCQLTVEHEPAERLSWYYAPRIGHYVRFEREGGKDGVAYKRELVAVRPSAPEWPPLARAELEKEVLHALANLPDGGRRLWTSTAIAAKVTIKTGVRFTGRGGEICRTYLQSWEAGGKVRYYPGAACRDDRGAWHLPLEAGAQTIPLAATAAPS